MPGLPGRRFLWTPHRRVGGGGRASLLPSPAQAPRSRPPSRGCLCLLRDRMEGSGSRPPRQIGWDLEVPQLSPPAAARRFGAPKAERAAREAWVFEDADGGGQRFPARQPCLQKSRQHLGASPDGRKGKGGLRPSVAPHARGANFRAPSGEHRGRRAVSPLGGPAASAAFSSPAESAALDWGRRRPR